MPREPLTPPVAFAVVFAITAFLGAVLFRPAPATLWPSEASDWFGKKAGGAVHLDAPAK